MFCINQIHQERPFGELSQDSTIVLYQGSKALMADHCHRLPTVADLPGFPPEITMMAVGSMDGHPCWGAPLPPGTTLPANCEFMECRLSFVHPYPDIANAISRCREFVHWRKGHRFCGACGAPTQFAENDLAILCPSCGMLYYPQLAPAVITMITRHHGKEILLAHNKRFSTPSFSLIAGFVEAGENLEQAVAREIMEETGVTVQNIQYLASQPWPFPNSLMLGFMAEYAGGTPYPKDGELTDIGWYQKDNLPMLPSPGSIARKIIDSYFEQMK